MTTNAMYEARRHNPFTGREETIEEMIAVGRAERSREIARLFGWSRSAAGAAAGRVKARSARASRIVATRLAAGAAPKSAWRPA